MFSSPMENFQTSFYLTFYPYLAELMAPSFLRHFQLVGSNKPLSPGFPIFFLTAPSQPCLLAPLHSFLFYTMFHSSYINIGMPGCFTVSLVKLRTTFPRILFPLPSDWNCSKEKLEWDLRNGTKAESLLSEEFSFKYGDKKTKKCLAGSYLCFFSLTPSQVSASWFLVLLTSNGPSHMTICLVIDAQKW